MKAQFCNAAEVLCSFANESADSDGWAMIAPYGDFPGMATITNADGSLSRVRAIQRIDRQAADAMVRNFRSTWARVRRFLTGAPIYLGHPDGLGIGDRYADKSPKGTFADLESRPNGLFGKPVFFNDGLELVAKFPALSGRWTAEEVGEEMHHGQPVKIFRPDVFKSAGLTNRPNLPVELMNELEAGQQHDTMKMTTELIALFKQLGIDFTNDATPEQISKAVEDRAKAIASGAELANEKATLESQLATEKEAIAARDATITALTREQDNARAEFGNERSARITLLLDTALADGRITPPTKLDWKKKLEASFTNESETLRKLQPVMKTQPLTGKLADRKVETADAQDRRARVVELVNETMTAHRLSYDDAFSKVRRDNLALFEAMTRPLVK